MLFLCAITFNGPAIWGGCVTWRSHPATDPGTRRRRDRKIVPVASQVRRSFCQSWYRVSGGLRVSRYRVLGEQGTSLGIRWFIEITGAIALSTAEGLALSWYTHPETEVLRKKPQKL